MLNNGKIAGFLFDNDGVILNTEEALVKINMDLLSDYNVVFDPNTRKYFSGKPDIEGLKVIIQKHGLEGKVTPEELSQRRKIVLDDWYKDAKFVPGFLDYYKSLKNEFREVIIGVASGTDPKMYNMADRKLHLRELFHNNICLSGEAGVRHKPAPDIFLYAAGMIRVPLIKCAIWEDSPLGLASAYDAGIRKLIGYTGTLSQNDLLEATENIIYKKLENHEDILCIDAFNSQTLEETIAYLMR